MSEAIETGTLLGRIFSFGAVLYEMLSGRRAFHAETPADTISAILREDPPELSATSGVVAPADPSGILDAPRLFLTPGGDAYVYFLRRLLCDLYVVEGLK